MALAAGTLWEIKSTASANNVNGGGFNIDNINFLTNLACDTGTGNTDSPVVSSASYNFVAGDVGAWVYIKSGTNWTPGFYQIASVATNKATLAAGIGVAVQYNNTTGSWGANTVVGCATVGTPTGGTFGVDYSQQDAAELTNTDLSTSGAAATTVTSASGGFTPVMAGNIIHITAGTNFTVGWYEIVSYTNTNNVVVDRTPSPSAGGSGGTFYVGGAMSLASTLDDDFFDIVVSGNTVFIKNGSYTLGESVIAANGGGVTTQIRVEGYNSVRGDAPAGLARPTIAAGAQSLFFNSDWYLQYLIITTTHSSGVDMQTGSRTAACKFVNTSTSTDRPALRLRGSNHSYSCEEISVAGHAILLVNSNTSYYITTNYIHNSKNGIASSVAGINVLIGDCIITACTFAAVGFTGATVSMILINANTLYGSSSTYGTGITLAAGEGNISIINNIIAGCATGVSHGTSGQRGVICDYNDFYNNDTDVTNVNKGVNSKSLNPQFTDVTELTGTGSTSGGVLSDGVQNFSNVQDNVDYLYVISGAAVGWCLITAHTATTVTLSPNPGDSGSVVYEAALLHNFAIGTNLKALGFPGVFPGGLTQGYTDIGAVQRQESGTGGYSGGNEEMTLYLKKNVAVEIKFSMTDSTTPANLKSGLSVTKLGYYKDGAGAWSGLSIAASVAEISTSGLYTLVLTSDEMNHDQIMLKFTATGAVAKVIEIHTFAVNVDDLVRSTTPANTLAVDSNSRIDVGKWLGTAVTLSATTNKPEVDVNSISNDSAAANNAEAFFDGTGYAGTNNTIPTVTGVTNTVSADVVSVSGDSAAAGNLESDYDGTGYNKANSTIGTCTTNTDMRGTDNALLASSAPANFSNMAITVTTGKVTVGTNDDKAGYSIAGTKTNLDALNDVSTAQVNAEVDAALADVNLDHIAGTASGIPAIPAGTYIDQIMDDGTATYDRTTDSLQAIRDRGDSAWVTGGGGSISDILNVSYMIPPSVDLANTATVRLGLILTNAIDDLPSAAEIIPGTVSIDRKAIGGASWSSVVTNAACSDSAGQIYYDEVFDSGSGYAEGDSVRITFKGQKITVASNDYEITDTTGIIFQTEIRQTMRGTNNAATASALSTMQTDVSAVKAKTDNLPASPANEITLSTIIANIAALNNISAAQVNAELSDVLKVDTIAELTQAQPTATPTFESALMLIYMWLRNKKTQSVSVEKIYNNSGINIIKAQVSDDGTTFTKDIMTAGS